MLNVFITGSDVQVGKTFITAGLAATMQSLGYCSCVYKPIQTGALGKSGFFQSPDLVFVKSIDPYIKTYSTYMLKDSTSPVIAAEKAGVNIDKNAIKLDYDIISKDSDCILTECTGGLMTPISPKDLMSDLIKALDLPIVIVMKPEEGAVNKTLLTINHAVAKGIKVRGVIINNYPEETNDLDVKTAPRLIEEYSDAKILGVIKHFKNFKNINPNDLITNILNGIDIESVFDVRIAKLEVE